MFSVNTIRTVDTTAVLYPIQGASHGFNNANLNGMASFVGGEKDDVVMPYVLRFLEEHI